MMANEIYGFRGTWRDRMRLFSTPAEDRREVEPRDIYEQDKLIQDAKRTVRRIHEEDEWPMDRSCDI